MKRRAFLSLAAAAALPLHGQSPAFPGKPVHIIVPFPPGGGADALARLMQPSLARLWDQAVVVENRPGASGQIGAEHVAAAPADGHVLLMSSTASLTEKNVHRFAPVTLVSASPYVIVIHPSVPAAGVRELVEHARRNPGKLSYGSSGVGAASHLSAELFKSQAKVDFLHVPYKGTGQAVTDLLSNQIQLMFAPAQTVMQYVQAKRLKALAVTSAKRSTSLPDLPTVAESGVPGYESIGWFGLLAPAGTPPMVVAKISADANRVLAEEDVRQKMLSVGAEPSGNSPEEFARFIRADQAKWSRLMAERGIKPE